MNTLHYPRTSAASGHGSAFDVKLQWLWQIALALIIFSVSGAGYYDQDIYAKFLHTGAVSVDTDMDRSPLTAIGTLASITAVLLLPLCSIRKMPSVLVGFFLFQIYILISGLWSFVPKETAFSVIKSCIYAVSLATLIQRMSYRNIVTSLAITAIVIAGFSLYLSFTDPVFRISLGTTGWRGLFPHKNRLAGFCLFMIILIIPSYYYNVRKRLVLFALSLLTLALLLSQGKTALAAAVSFVILTVWPISIAKRRGGLSFLHENSMIFLIFVVFIIFPFVVISTVIGDITFTGRINTWANFLSATADNRFFGLGGYTIFSDENFSKFTTREFGAPTPDSSLVSMLCNFGILGITLYLIFLGYCWIEMLRRFNKYSIFGLLTILMYVIYGSMESDAQLGLSLPTVALLTQALISQRIFEATRVSIMQCKIKPRADGNDARLSGSL